MRRTAVLAALAAGVLAVAGCGGDEGKDSDGSVEAICTSMQSVAEPLDDEFGPALTEAGIAGAQGDQEALAEAMTKLDQVTEQITTAANEADVEQVADLLHGKEQQVWADSGYRGAQSRVDREDLQWHIAARPSDIAKLPEGKAKTRVQKQEHRKASVRAKVEHPFRVIKRQFGLVKVRFRGLQKNTAHLLTLFALSNLWMARRQLMASMGAVRPKTT